MLFIWNVSCQPDESNTWAHPTVRYPTLSYKRTNNYCFLPLTHRHAQTIAYQQAQAVLRGLSELEYFCVYHPILLKLRKEVDIIVSQVQIAVGKFYLLYIVYRSH